MKRREGRARKQTERMDGFAFCALSRTHSRNKCRGRRMIASSQGSSRVGTTGRYRRDGLVHAHGGGRDCVV